MNLTGLLMLLLSGIGAYFVFVKFVAPRIH
jgi:hypothetical protein